MSKILIIDDDESILDAMSLILEEEGYKTKTAFKGQEAFPLITSFKPDLILLDMLLSGQDGRDICKKLKADPKTTAIPIIMISAHPSADATAMQAGSNDFVAKPFDTAVLLEKIKQYC